MTHTAMGEGERAEAARRRRSLATIGVSVVVAVVIIGAAALFNQGHGKLAPAGAIVISVIYTLASLGSYWWVCRRVDEVEGRANLRAIAAGGAAYALVYPSWYFLWRGGLLSEPSHELLYVITLATFLAVYLWKKIR